MAYQEKTSPAGVGISNRTSLSAVMSQANNSIVVSIKGGGKQNGDDAWSFACRVLLQEECKKVAAAERSKRWPTFANAAFMLAGLVPEGALTETQVRLQLTGAANQAGMQDFTRVIDAAFVESTRPHRSGRYHG